MIDLSKDVYVYDIETDGLIDQVTKIHCLSFTFRNKEGNLITESTTDYKEMRKFFSRQDILRVGHNISLYDERVSSKILGIDLSNNTNDIIDTLSLSWYLYPEIKRHSLEEWGNRVGVSKIRIGDWKGLSTSEYIKRCEVDTQINFKVWEVFYSELMELYKDPVMISRFLTYIQFKLDCIKEQEECKLRIDLSILKTNLEKLKSLKKEKEEVLKSIMPQNPIYNKKEYKNVIVVSDSEIYTSGDLMYEHYKSLGYKLHKEYVLSKVIGHNPPNPNSVDQKKNWLFSLGWKPLSFKEVEGRDGIKKVPQITSLNNSGEVCQSVRDLFDKEPKLEVIEGLSVLSHRIGVLEGILENQKDGFIEASAHGLTNTLRLKHVNVVNLPSVDKSYGTEIREVFVANEGMILCGSDMSSLEDSTKQHYIYNFDPEYVKEMRTPGFDPHLDIAVLSGLLTEEQSNEHKLHSETKGKEGKSYKSIRHKAKTTNFSATYGAGPPKIAKTANISIREAELLHSIYWKRNSAVKRTADSLTVKSINGKQWLFNPVSGFWYSLRAEKDKFSTLNQGTGVYCFDMYIMSLRNKGIKISLQMHDEILFNVIKGKEENIEQLLKESITEVNSKIKLNIPLGISIDFGNSYADCH